MTNLQPIPTEYVGITFKSKSEAVFARGLDLIGFDWEYEPQPFQTGDLWIPDFLAVSKGAEHTLGLWLIEYKPSKPTQAYIALMAKRAIELEPFLRGFILIVFYGSSFNEDFGGLVWQAGGPGFIPLRQPTVLMFSAGVKEASGFRFDLVHDP